MMSFLRDNSNKRKEQSFKKNESKEENVSTDKQIVIMLLALLHAADFL